MRRWKKIKRDIQATLDIADGDFLDVVMATTLSVDLPWTPVWIMVAAASGSSKTEVLRMFDGKRVHHVTGATENALVSGMVLKDDDGETIKSSLLQRINGHCWFIKDFSQILNLPPEKRAKFMSVLRDAYDGHVNQAFGGAAQEQGFHCHFGIIAATTSVFEAVISSQEQAFGERFLVFRPEVKDRLEFIAHVIEMAHTSHIWRPRLCGLVHDFLEEVRIPSGLKPNLKGVHRMADLTAMARSPVIRNIYRMNEVEVMPEPEYGSRIASALVTVGTACQFIGANPQRIIKRIARDTIPRQRFCVLEHVYERQHCKVSDIVGKVALCETAIRRALEDLQLLGVLKQARVSIGRRGRPLFVYSINPKQARSFELLFGDKWMEDSK